MIVHKYHVFPGIIQLNKYLISQDMVESIIASTL